MKKPLILNSWEEVEERASVLEEDGWEIRTSFYPLHGQRGYQCTLLSEEAGQVLELEETFVFNIFGKPLQPLVLPCETDQTLLSFLWQHSPHGLTYFETNKAECGLICYCKGKMGKSHVLLVDTNVHDLSEQGWTTMKEYMQDNPKFYD